MHFFTLLLNLGDYVTIQISSTKMKQLHGKQTQIRVFRFALRSAFQ